MTFSLEGRRFTRLIVIGGRGTALRSGEGAIAFGNVN